MRKSLLTTSGLLATSLLAVAQEPGPAPAASPRQEAIGLALDTALLRTVRPVVVRSSAPVGSRVTLDGVEARIDSAGRWEVAVPADSVRRATGVFELCLELSGQKACSPLRPQGFDTLDIKPLEMAVDSVIEKRDTVVQVELPPPPVDNPKMSANAAGRTVTIKGRRRPPRVLGQERVTVQTIKRLPGLAEPDVIRAVQALPGVVASSDFSTKLYVRGGGADQNLILFDNAVVYTPTHFGGLFSTFLADATGGLEFYKGGFDPKYGNRLSSVLLVSSKTGGSDARDSLSGMEKTLNSWFLSPPLVEPDTAASAPSDSGSGEAVAMDEQSPMAPQDTLRLRGSTRITTFSGSVAADLRKGEWSFAGATRRTWIDQALSAAKDAGLTDFTLSYYFYDNQANVAWGRDGDSVRASIYQGRDQLDFAALNLEWGNFVVPINVRKQIGPSLVYRGTYAWSKFDQVVRFGDILQLDNSVETWNTRQELQWDPVREHRLSAGYELNTYDVLFRQNILVAQIDYKEQTDNLLHAAWLQDRWNIGKNHTVTAGLRGYYSRELGFSTDAIDPRASWTWRFAPDWKLDLGAGHYTQYMTSLSFGDGETPTDFWYSARGNMKPSTQWMSSVGVERTNLTDLGLRTSVEAYYKSLNDLPLFFQNNTAAEDNNDDLAGKEYFANNFSRLHGYSTGAEFAINKEDGWWTGSLSYSLSFAALQQETFTNNIDTITFRPYWASWDQRNTGKLTAGLNWIGRTSQEGLHVGRNVPTWVKVATTIAFPPTAFCWWGTKADYLRSNVQINYADGQPYTGYDGYQRTHEPFQSVNGQDAGEPVAIENNTRTVQGEKNRERKTNYFRMDVTPVDFGRTGKWRFYWTIINATDNENLFFVNYNTQVTPPERQDVYQFPFLPVFLGYEYEF